MTEWAWPVPVGSGAEVGVTESAEGQGQTSHDILCRNSFLGFHRSPRGMLPFNSSVELGIVTSVSSDKQCGATEPATRL
jgi:hypothetical protein